MSATNQTTTNQTITNQPTTNQTITKQKDGITTSYMKNISTLANSLQRRFNLNPLKYSLSFLLMIFFSLILYFIPGYNTYTRTDAAGNKLRDPSVGSSAKMLKNQAYFYTSATLFIIFACLYFIKFVSTQYKRAAFIGSGVFVVIVVLYYLLIKSGIYNNEYAQNIGYTILAVIPIILLYRSIKKHIPNIEGLPGFILNFILFIPCLFDDFAEYLKANFARTTNITYALLGIQALLITAYVALPSVSSSLLKGDAFPIMNEANFLDKRNGTGRKQIDFTIFKDVYGYTDDSLKNTNDYDIGKHTFTMSMWIYLNQQDHSISTSPQELFSYGSSHPSVKFSCVKNGKNKLNLKLSGDSASDIDTFEVNIESQKWNNLVFNYNGNVVDIFINGDLVKSHKINKPLQISKNDILDYGSSAELDGAICNIKYYKKPLTKFQIVNIYNLLNGLNPPINNIM